MNFDLKFTRPDYAGNSIVNLMASLKAHFGIKDPHYVELEALRGCDLARDRRIVLIVIDGLGADLLDSFAGRSPDENFKHYQRARITSVYPPTTASAVTTFMSGQAPQQHGLTGWFMNFREIGAVSAVLPFASRFGRKALSEQGVDISRLVSCARFSDLLPVTAQMLLPSDIVDSEFSRHLGGRAKRVSYRGLTDFKRKLDEFLRADSGADYLYAYWSELDHLAHQYGPSNERVLDHYQALENSLLPILKTAAEHNCCVIVTADHGFLDSGPQERVELEAHPQLSDMLAMPLFGEPRSAYCVVRKGCDDEFEAYVAENLNDFMTAVPSAQLIANNWFGVGKAHTELAARVGDYTLQMKQRYTVRDRLVSEHAFDLYGMHGGITAAEQWVPLIVFV